jgi:hypothetical protein
MALVQGWINIYRSGVYHTEGKPFAFDRHGGDIYPSEQAALLAVDPLSHYISTEVILWHEPTRPAVNYPPPPKYLPTNQIPKYPVLLIDELQDGALRDLEMGHINWGNHA